MRAAASASRASLTLLWRCDGSSLLFAGKRCKTSSPPRWPPLQHHHQLRRQSPQHSFSQSLLVVAVCDLTEGDYLPWSATAGRLFRFIIKFAANTQK
jgi:hypothetical protein